MELLVIVGLILLGLVVWMMAALLVALLFGGAVRLGEDEQQHPRDLR